MAGYDDIPLEGELSDDSVQQQGGEGATDTNQQQQTTSQVPGQQAAAGAGPAAPAPAWDGSQWQLKYRGSPYTPKTREELVSLAQKGFSYNQEMERINRERREHQEQLQQMQSRYKHYDDFDALLKSNPALAERMVQLTQEFQQGGGATNGSAGNGANYQMYNQLVERLGKLESTYTESLNAEADRKLEESISKLKAGHPEHDWESDEGNGNLEQQLIRFAIDNGLTNIEHAYRVMMWDQRSVQDKAAALKGAAAAKQAAAKAGVVSGGKGGGPVPKAGYKYGDSYNDLTKKMLAEMIT